jgi:antitoxin component HigA of HigAB toxin-antitoxin module
MKDEQIYNLWTEFINDIKYKKYFTSGEEEWNQKLKEVKQYIDKYNERPSSKDKNNNKDIKILGEWINTQLNSYKKKEYIMKDEQIYNLWTEFINDIKYKKYFTSGEEEWNQKLKEVKKYIDEHIKRPSSEDKNNNIKKLGCWILNQQTNYKKKEQIMSKEIIYNKWTEFINNQKYKVYFESNVEEWQITLNEVIKYIDDHNKRPSAGSNCKIIKKLGSWLTRQITNYKTKSCILSNEEIYNMWTTFINDDRYSRYFISNAEEWQITLNEVKKYIDNHNKRPSVGSNCKIIKKLGAWIETQQHKYKNKKHIMSEEIIYNKWTEFITDPKYNKYF